MAKRRNFIKNTAAALGGLYLVNATSCGSNKSAVVEDSFISERKSLIKQANFGRKKPAKGSNGLAISSHPLVSQEAVRILKSGGNAADAALAASITQTVVEPHMTTLTGVFSILYYDAKTGKYTYINGSSNAPLALDKKNFDISKLWDLMKSPQGAIVPGFWGGFEKAHQELGSLPIKKLMASAIRYAREGFEVHPFLYGEMIYTNNAIGVTPEGREIFMPKGRLVNPGEMIYQKRAADLLERLSEEGSNYFYHGGFAQKFAALMKKTSGIVTEKDFEQYEALVQQPSKGAYRDYQIIGSPPPDYGGAAMIEILQMAEHIDFQKMGSPTENPETALKMMQILGEVLTTGTEERLANKVTPIEKTLSKAYAAERFHKLSGKPKGLMDLKSKTADNIITPPPGSNHLTVVDKDGNVATVLHSCMCLPWSCGLFVDGISVATAIVHYGNGIPNPGERINARICPTIMFKDGKPVLASGSPSVSLMENIFQTTVQLLDFKKTPEEAVHLPRWGGGSMDFPGSMLIEVDYNEKVVAALEKKNIAFQKVSPWNFWMGSFEGIYMDSETGIAHACGDPRRNAMAIAV